MQLLFFVFSALLTCSAVASNFVPFELPSPLKEGVYQYLGKYEIHHMVDQESVDRKFQEQRYQELIKNGYGCVFKSNMIYLCKKTIQPAVASVALTEKINKKFEGYTVTVHGGTSVPALVESGDYFTTWKVENSVDFPEMSFNEYLLVRKPGYFGAWFKRSIYDKSLEIVSDNELRQTEEIWVKQSGTVNWVYYVDVLFNR